MSTRISVVLVTHNRLECLKVALKRYEEQTILPSHIVVVDNASTDTTREYLDAWTRQQDGKFVREAIHCEKNLGGSGGFCVGMERVVQTDCNFVFLADDDAYAQEDMFEELIRFYEARKDKQQIMALCTAVLNHGKIDCVHRRRIKRNALYIEEYPVSSQEYESAFFPVDELSFVGAMIKKEAIKKIGFPNKEFFIQYDDTEYSLRLREIGVIYCVVRSKMHHDTIDSQKITWKNYYSLRNKMLAIKIHYPRRYFYTAVLMAYIKRCSLLARLLKKRTPAQAKMYRTAISDAMHGRLGMHEVYRPGVDIESIY